ncbi:hypothetical protein, partial [Mycobacterium tuberculosis]|uniref:hypothetical protein n=1 Tax=Mycobacterium tuberculosis TaxID=1773 RepID=UPI000AE2C70D
DAQRSAVIATLARALKSTKGVHRKARAVDTASSALGRINAKYTTLRIEHAADVLSLGDAWKASAKELGKFRNTKLGHGGATPTNDELDYWHHGQEKPDSAFSIAASILGAASEFVASKPAA